MTYSKQLLTFIAICFCVNLNASAATRINGAGATFPYPIYAQWISSFNQSQDDYQFNYQSIGSGGGIRQFSNSTVHFGATDAPMRDQQIENLDREILHIPTIMGAVAVAHNIPGFKKTIQMDGQTLALIFMGKIKYWDDPKIKAHNPELSIPNEAIMPIRRADGAGTTDVFSDYLSKVSSKWQKKVGRGVALRWIGQNIGAKGNEGVTSMLRQIPGSIGYIELAYARQFNFSLVALKNTSGHYTLPDTQSITHAASGLEEKDYYGDYRLSITNSAHPEAYPISAFSYILINTQNLNQFDLAVRQFLTWALTAGQEYAERLFYAPLPERLREIIIKRLEITELDSDAKKD